MKTNLLFPDGVQGRTQSEADIIHPKNQGYYYQAQSGEVDL
jgi:hypothetical protein